MRLSGKSFLSLFALSFHKTVLIHALVNLAWASLKETKKGMSLV